MPKSSSIPALASRCAAAAAAVAVVVVAVGCGKSPAAAPPPKQPSSAPQVTAKPPAPPPKPTAQQMAELEADFATARKIAEEARELRKQGEQIEREKGREAANATLAQARRKYRDAVGRTERWVEPDLGAVTKGQIEAYLQAWFRERASWIQEDASMGQKLHD